MMNLPLSSQILLFICISSTKGLQEDQLKFPDGFLIGSSTSSYQIEGGWNISDKGENVWDRFTHDRPDQIMDRSNGDIACDSYHKYKEDVQILKQLGMQVYRFSISWSRLLPTGYANVVSKDGLNYYNNLINELLKYNITPMISLFHWDHPQRFERMGGWTNEAIVELFADYARIIYEEFGDRVKHFVTINEPRSICNSIIMPNETGTAPYGTYLCDSNVLKAHARAYHIYDKEFRPKQRGQIGIVLDTHNYISKQKGDNESDEVAFQFHFGRYAHPIFSKEGDWPAVLKQRIDENSKFEGLPRSRLPRFSKEWIAYIKGTADFVGLNHYTSQYAEPAPKSNHTIFPNDHGLIFSLDEKWPKTSADWLRMTPEGFLTLLLKIKKEYNNPLLYITENGLPDTGAIQDDQRTEYLYSYMKSMLTAIHVHGCNVRGYMYWSLLDNFEWTGGYSIKYGIVHVDFTSPNRTRTLKKSTAWLRDTIRARQLLALPKDIRVERT